MRYSIRALIGALAVAMVAAVLVFKVASTQQDPTVSGNSGNVTVLVATKLIPPGTTLAEVRDKQMVSTMTKKVTEVPSDALTAISPDIEQRMAVAQMVEGSVLAASNFTDTLINSGPLGVPSGMVALSVMMGDEASRVGNFIRPGAEVTIYATAEVAAGANGNPPAGKETRILFPRVRVLAVGAATTREAADAAGGSSLITVVVTPKQGQKLIQALQTTSLYMALLNGETNVPITGPVNGQNLYDEVN